VSVELAKAFEREADKLRAARRSQPAASGGEPSDLFVKLLTKRLDRLADGFKGLTGEDCRLLLKLENVSLSLLASDLMPLAGNDQSDRMAGEEASRSK